MAGMAAKSGEPGNERPVEMVAAVGLTRLAKRQGLASAWPDSKEQQ
jgi:hypothetical protein